MDPKVVPVNLGTLGMFASGEPTAIPDGYVRSMRNMLIRPNRIATRPPFVYDNLMAISGLMRWEDLVNQQTRFLALDTSRNLYIKSATTEAWSAAITGTLTASRITDYANYRGKVYYMLDDGAGNPIAAAMFDGTTITANPFSSAIFARTVTAFIDRLILGAPRVTITNRLFNSGTGPLPAYALDDVTYWAATNVTATSVASGGTTIVRLTPTSTAANACQVVSKVAANQTFNLPASASVQSALASVYLFNDSTVDVPVTLEAILTTNANWAPGNAYPLNSQLLVATVPGGTVFLYEATVGGVSGGGFPAVWPSAIGGTLVDNTVTWTNRGPQIIGSSEFTLTPDSAWLPHYVLGTVAYLAHSIPIAIRVKFYNSSVTALTSLVSVGVSLRDGLADGNPLKRDYGCQITLGDFFYPFFNQESSASATVSLSSWIWSETTQPKVIRAANTEEPQEAAGLPTAACVLSGRFIGFKRRAFWVFKGSSDPDNPLLSESPATMTDGCLGPRALAVIEDEAYFIGENEIYSFRVGGYPRPICGDAMFETIMARGANWVENQSVYNMPLLAIDKAYGEVWVYTQKGKLFCYHMPETSAPSAASALFASGGNKGSWTTHDVGGAEVAAMAFNPITQEMEFAFGGHGLARLDSSVTAQDTIDNTGTLYPVTKDIILKPFELYSPRYELCLHDIGIYHLASFTQAGEALYAYVSFDRGATYPKSNEVRFDPANPRIPISIFQAGLSVQVKLSHVGSAGEAAWAVSRGEATLELMSGEWPLSRPTQIASNL